MPAPESPIPNSHRPVAISTGGKQPQDPVLDLTLPPITRSIGGLRSVPERAGKVWQDHWASLKSKTWTEIVVDVERACPMHTNPERLARIQEGLLNCAAEWNVKGAVDLNINGKSFAPAAIAKALWSELEIGEYEPQEVIEAAVQLYLQGSHGNIIPSEVYRLFSEAIFHSGTGAPRRGVWGDGKFAHGEAIHQLLFSKHDAQRSCIRSLFENGTIAHLALWTRGARPAVIEEFILETFRYARLGDDDGKSRTIDSKHFVKVLLPHLVDSCLASAPVFSHLKWLDVLSDQQFSFKSEHLLNRLAYVGLKGWAWVDGVKQAVLKVVPFSFGASKARLLTPRFGGMASGKNLVPVDYIRLARDEIAQSKIVWEIPTANYAERLKRDSGYSHLTRAVFEVTDRMATCQADPPLKEWALWFFPPHFFTTSSPMGIDFGRIPAEVEIQQSFADMIVVKKVEDAFAFHDVIQCLRQSYLMRDEDDLYVTLSALHNNLFAKSEHSRLKVATYVCELIKSTQNADYIAVFDDALRGNGPSKWMPEHGDREVKFAAGLMGLREFVAVHTEPADPEDLPDNQTSERIMQSVLNYPLASAALVYWLSLFNRERPEPLSFRGEILKDLRGIKERWLERYTSFRERNQNGEEQAAIRRRQVRIDRTWNGFFDRASSVPIIGAFASAIKAKVNHGKLTSRELSTISDFFKTITGMPCPTKFLYLHFRAAQLNLDYSFRFPVWERLRLPGATFDVAFPEHALGFKGVAQFKDYVRHRTSHILLNQETFVPENECDLELFALVCRLYRNGVPPEEVQERTLRALLPEWNPLIDGKSFEFDVPKRSPSVFDEVIRSQDLERQKVTVERNTGQTVDVFRKKIDAMRKDRAASMLRFLEHSAALDRVSEIGPLTVINHLEAKYGLPAAYDGDGDHNLSESGAIHQRVVRLVEHLGERGNAIEVADADLLFCAHTARGAARRGSLSHILEFEGDVERWGGLLEFVSEGVSDPFWDEVLAKAASPIREVFNKCTDVSYLENELLPVTVQDIGGKKKASVKVQFALTRGPASRFIGSICDTCALETLDAHPNKAFVTFSQQEGEGGVVNSFLGGCVLIHTTTKSGEPAIILRGFNPQLRLLKKVSVNGFYDAFVQYVAEHVAKPLGVRQILAPYEMVSGGAFSNRPLTHLAFKSRFRNHRTVVELSEAHNTTYNNRDVSDRCILVWSDDSGRIPKSVSG